MENEHMHYVLVLRVPCMCRN